MPFKKLKTIRGHTGLARFLATVELLDIQVTRQTNIPSPYAYAPAHCVYRMIDKFVIIVETSHGRHDIFEVPKDSQAAYWYWPKQENV